MKNIRGVDRYRGELPDGIVALRFEVIAWSEFANVVKEFSVIGATLAYLAIFASYLRPVVVNVTRNKIVIIIVFVARAFDNNR